MTVFWKQPYLLNKHPVLNSLLVNIADLGGTCLFCLPVVGSQANHITYLCLGSSSVK